MEGGEGGREDGGVRQREEGNPGRENYWADRDLIVQVKGGKGGGTRQGKPDTALHEELLGMTSRVGKC